MPFLNMLKINISFAAFKNNRDSIAEAVCTAKIKVFDKPVSCKQLLFMPKPAVIVAKL